MPDLAADVALLADADRREPLQHYGKDQQRVDGDDEVGNRDEADRQHRDQLVREAIAANGGEAAERDADEGGPADGAQHQGDRVGQLAQDDVGDRLITDDVDSEIAGQHAEEERSEEHTSELPSLMRSSYA